MKASAEATSLGGNGRVAFSGQFMEGIADDVPRIFSTDLRYADVQQLTCCGTALAPAYSPDGSKIAYYASSIYVMNADGSEDTAVVLPGGSPRWSPDGSRLVYRAGDIYSVRVDGTDLVRLTRDGFGRAPTWSPDGTKIALVGYRENSLDIYTMNADGTGLLPITAGPGNDDQPDWSPDGDRIVFHRTTRHGGGDIYSISPTGDDEVKLSDVSGEGIYNVEPVWSPDGTKIAFNSNRAGNPDIWVMAADGGDPINLTGPITPGRAYEFYPSWQPLCTVRGTPETERLVGTAGRDLVCGRGGDDLIEAGGGDDVIFAGPGADTVYAGPGEDIVVGEAGFDRLYGGGGEDWINASDDRTANDRVDGGTGVDRCEADHRDRLRACP